MYSSRYDVTEQMFRLSNAKFRDELLNGEIFYLLREAQILVEPRRPHFKVGTGRVVSSLAVLG